jgi:uncharacterized protein (DUF302 family)
MKARILTTVLISSLIILSANAQDQGYYFSRTLDVSYEKAIEKLKVALKDQGFGVVSETAMHETINAKIPGSNMDPYIVFGACNAKYAYEMLEMEENIGLLLPCKIIVKYLGEENSEIVIMNPSVILSVSKNDDITSYSTSVTKKLTKVLEAL